MEGVAAAVKTVDGVVAEIMRMHKTLPPRPDIEEVESARTLIRNLEREEQAKLDAIKEHKKGKLIPEELFFICLEMHKAVILYQSKEQKRDAVRLLDLESAHKVFDDLIERAFQCVSPNTGNGYSSSSSKMRDFCVGSNGSKDFSGGFVSNYVDKGIINSVKKSGLKNDMMFSRDDSYVMKSKVNGFGSSITTVLPTTQIHDSSLKTSIQSAQHGEKLSLIKLASLIEVSAKKGTREINLQGKLLDQVEWLPDSIGKLSSLVSLDMSENQIVALPATIGGLFSLSKLDLHSNRFTELPGSIGDLLNLVFLDLRGNNLVRLPSNVGRLMRLEELDLSANSLSVLPDTIGSLISLKKLNVETNDLDELPHTIGLCSSLQELRLNYNRLRALPEAVGKIETLEILSVRYNNIRQLPTTMSALGKLRELDVSFNGLESVPESLCFAVSLVKLNISNNFADVRSLPRSIGNLEMLKVLDISNNQIRILPDSFRFLSKLTALYVDQNPLEVPPRQIADKGAQAVVQYMADLVANRDVKEQPTKQKKTWLEYLLSSV